MAFWKIFWIVIFIITVIDDAMSHLPVLQELSILPNFSIVEFIFELGYAIISLFFTTIIFVRSFLYIIGGEIAIDYEPLVQTIVIVLFTFLEDIVGVMFDFMFLVPRLFLAAAAPFIALLVGEDLIETWGFDIGFWSILASVDFSNLVITFEGYLDLVAVKGHLLVDLDILGNSPLSFGIELSIEPVGIEIPLTFRIAVFDFLMQPITQWAAAQPVLEDWFAHVITLF
ncbi:MAG: hypothetical protein ACTSP4_00125 [Candidatus Hodarchaeales archaeon]